MTDQRDSQIHTKTQQVTTPTPEQNNKPDKTLGGFVAYTHAVAKRSFGPECPFDRNTNLFNMIQFHLIANWQIKMSFSNKFLKEATGLSTPEIQKAKKHLAKHKMLQIETRRINGVWQDSIYQLHPGTFGTNPLWQGEGAKKPTFQVVQGGKFIDSDTGGYIPIEVDPPQKGISRSGYTGCIPIGGDQTPQEPLPEPLEPSHKNSVLRICSKNTTGENVESKGICWEEAKAKLLVRYPNDSKRLDEAYAQLSRDRIYFKTNVPVSRPAGFLLKSWDFARNEYAYVDQVKPKEREPVAREEEVVSDPHAKEEALKKLHQIFGNTFRSIPK